jgi:glycosyltransferase involved in cell wall biosynthesis
MWGGMSLHCYHLSRELAKKGVQVTVFCAARKPSTTCEASGLEVRRLPGRFINTPPNFLWFQMENLRRLKRLVTDYDVVHSEQNSGTILAILRKKIDLPWVVSFHGSWLSRLAIILNSHGSMTLGDYKTYVFGLPVYKTLAKLELKFSDLKTVCSKALARELSSDYSMKLSEFRVIGNGVDVNFIESIRKQHESSAKERQPTVFFCGRLYKIKGIDYLLEAVTLLRRRYPNIRLKIFGRGPARENIAKFIQSAGLRDNVMLEGYLPNPQLITELVQSDLAVFPSLYEAQSIAMLEAMASRIPVVAFDLPFSREIMNHGETGLLARPRDARDLASCVSMLLDSSHLRQEIGRNSQRYVMSHHDWSRIAEQFISAYHDAEKLVEHNNVLRRSRYGVA